MLTELQLRQAKPKSTNYKLSAERGMFLLVTPNGGKWWRLKYRFGGKEKLLSLGVYPEVSFKAAKDLRDNARALLRKGIDPSAQRAADKEQSKRELISTFEAAADGWLAFKTRGWAAETERKARYVVDKYLKPALGPRSISTLTSKDVSVTLLKLADHAPDLAKKARQHIDGIVRYAQREGLRDESRALPLREILPSYAKGHIAAATTPAEIAPVLRAIHAYRSPITRAALLMCAYTALRPGVVAAMRWDEIHGNEWHIPGSKMKMRFAHIVSLPTQALVLVDEMRTYTGGREFVFPALARQKNLHLNRDSLSAALRDMGFQGKHAPHGFRGMLRTAGRERLKIDMDILESQLAHAKKGDANKAYDRTTFDDDRRDAMQKWANYLDELREERKVVDENFGRTS